MCGARVRQGSILHKDHGFMALPSCRPAQTRHCQALISLQVFNCRNVHADPNNGFLGLQQKIRYDIMTESPRPARPVDGFPPIPGPAHTNVLSVIIHCQEIPAQIGATSPHIPIPPLPQSTLPCPCLIQLRISRIMCLKV